MNSYAWLTALMNYYWEHRAWGKYEVVFFARAKLGEEVALSGPQG